MFPGRIENNELYIFIIIIINRKQSTVLLLEITLDFLAATGSSERQ